MFRSFKICWICFQDFENLNSKESSDSKLGQNRAKRGSAHQRPIDYLKKEIKGDIRFKSLYDDIANIQK